jgi:outer membrane lipoprotein LolB
MCIGLILGFQFSVNEMVIAVGHDYYSPMRADTSNPITPSTRTALPGFSLVLLWLLLSGGCSSLPEAPVTNESRSDWANHQTRLAEFNTWELHARSAIFADDEVYHVGINWQRQQARFVLVIEAPFGQGVFRVESNLGIGNTGLVVLSLPDGQQYFDDSAEALLLRVLGWALPVKGLESWIKGLPDESDNYLFELRGDGRLKSLQQNDWTINYLEYFDTQSETPGLPRKMYLKHSDLALKIVVDRWHQDDVQGEAPQLFPEFD